MTSFNLVDVAVGGALAVGGYFVYLAVTKGLTYAITALKTWWGEAETELKAMVTDLEARVTALEGKIKPPGA
jgi:hypothetical protein